MPAGSSQREYIQHCLNNLNYQELPKQSGMALLLRSSTYFELMVLSHDFPPLLAENCFPSQFASHCHLTIPRAVAVLGRLSSLSHTPAICALVGDNAVNPIVGRASVPSFCLGWLSLSQVPRCGYSLSSRGFV